jgi:peptide/nickel transport system permease protein
MLIRQNNEQSLSQAGQTQAIAQVEGGASPQPASVPWLRRLAQSPALRSRKIRVGLTIVGFFLLLALFGPLLARYNPLAISPNQFDPPSAQHWLGTTFTGQDVFSQVVDGARVTLLVGIAVGVLATLLSVVIGLAAGYFGGLIDELLSMLTNIFLVIPALPLAIVLAGYVKVKGPLPVAIIITATGWAWGARVLRAQTLSMRRRDFVEAARATGESTLRILFAEILPNEIAIVASSLIFTIIYAILAQIGLEFLGLGDTNINSWGNMLFEAYSAGALLVGAWWWFVPPGVCIALLGAGWAFINFGIDEITNPRLRDASRS